MPSVIVKKQNRWSIASPRTVALAAIKTTVIVAGSDYHLLAVLEWRRTLQFLEACGLRRNDLRRRRKRRKQEEEKEKKKKNFFAFEFG